MVFRRFFVSFLYLSFSSRLFSGCTTDEAAWECLSLPCEGIAVTPQGAYQASEISFELSRTYYQLNAERYRHIITLYLNYISYCLMRSVLFLSETLSLEGLCYIFVGPKHGKDEELSQRGFRRYEAPPDQELASEGRRFGSRRLSLRSSKIK